ncbi:T9SS type A sorting domain-containing protein [Maribacter halichondriae]|uniref:T9SS type A sorting domain-containing protein n=1 Tax=Maribacter halichondriae TaxID=2980554 RepID=UPI00235900BC|nr:T9SS type A sorting domain-containing protein [Maribacter sp. Hal144]
MNLNLQEAMIFLSANWMPRAILYGQKNGGEDADAGYSIAVDVFENVYITGYFTGTADFDPDDVGVLDLVSEGEEDIFISKLDVLGNLVWAKRIGGILGDQGNSVAVDDTGNVHTTGFFRDTADFDPDITGIHNLSSSGATDIFISKLDASGNFVGAGKMGGDLYDVGNSIALDELGNIYTTGSFQARAYFDPKAGMNFLESEGGRDIFISKLDASGNFVGARRMGGPLDDEGTSIALGIAGNIYTTGFFDGTADFDPDAVATFDLTVTGGYPGAIDIFVSKLDKSGNFKWAKNMGGSGLDSGSSINVDPWGNVYTTGYFTGIAADFDPGLGIQNLDSQGGLDIFISKLSASGNFKSAKSMGAAGNDSGSSIAVDPNFNVYSTGSFEEEADFDPGTGVDNLLSNGLSDIFVQKLSNYLSIPSKNEMLSLPLIFPNPTTDNLTLDLGQLYDTVTLNVRNFSGELVSKANYNKTDKIDFDINSSPGMYFIEVIANGKKLISLKVVKN